MQTRVISRRTLAAFVALLFWSYLAWVVTRLITVMYPTTPTTRATWGTLTLAWTDLAMYVGAFVVAVIASAITLRRAVRR